MKIIATDDACNFFNLPTNDELLWIVESLLLDHRECLYPPAETLVMFPAPVMNTLGFTSMGG